MSRALRFLVLLLAFASALCAQDNKSYKLVAVRFKGLHEFKAEEVADVTGLKIGSVIVPGELQSAADKLVATGAFASVGFSYAGERGGYAVEFQVEEAPRYLAVEFENFVWAGDDELIRYISARVPLFHGRTTESGAMIQNILDALNLWLGEHNVKGLAVYRLNSDLQRQTVNAVNFYIDGMRMPVREVSIDNAPNLTAKEKDHLIKQLVGNDYERSIANFAVSLGMEAMYQRKGYLRATASLPKMKILTSDGAQAEIALAYTIDEGKQYKIQSLRWTGNTSLPSADLDKALKLQPGSVADVVELQTNLHEAEKLYGVMGMLRAHVEPKPSYDDAAATVGFELAVTEGPVFKMGTVQFSGLKQSEIEEMRSRWKLKLGETYNSEYLKEFLKSTVSITQGRRAKVQQTIAPGNVVHLKLEFD